MAEAFSRDQSQDGRGKIKGLSGGTTISFSSSPGNYSENDEREDGGEKKENLTVPFRTGLSVH